MAALYEDFPGVRNYRAEETGAEWISGKGQALTRIARAPIDQDCRKLPADGVFLRIWGPSFARLGRDAPVEVTVGKAGRFLPAQIRRGDPTPSDAAEKHWTLNLPLSLSGDCSYERVYALPPDLILEPQRAYWISGRLPDRGKTTHIFRFTFRTDSRGLPAAY